MTRRNPSPMRVGDAQADAFLRMREDNHQQEQVRGGGGVKVVVVVVVGREGARPGAGRSCGAGCVNSRAVSSGCWALPQTTCVKLRALL